MLNIVLIKLKKDKDDIYKFYLKFYGYISIVWREYRNGYRFWLDFFLIGINKYIGYI